MREVCKVASNLMGSKKLFCQLKYVLLGLWLIGSHAMAGAENNCPWMNEATASGLLGGDATGSYTKIAAGEPAACSFAQKSTDGQRMLQVTVEVATDPHARMRAATRACGPDAAPLTSIGNEALECIVNDNRGGHSAWAIGRVRDQVFTIRLKTTLKGDPVLSRDALQARIYTAAEQVSGNLF
jgi:hypothetical protein